MREGPRDPIPASKQGALERIFARRKSMQGIHVQWAFLNYSFLFQLVRLCKQYGRRGTFQAKSEVHSQYQFCGRFAFVSEA